MIKVKICGITNQGDADAAINYGADALGFVFFKKSPRYIDQHTAQKICATLPPFITTVGVFVNEDPAVINAILKSCDIGAAQLSGDETEEGLEKISGKVIKGFRVEDDDFSAVADIIRYKGDTVLLDSYSKDKYGGSGKVFNWDIALEVRGHKRVILSGGLNCDNILSAIKKVAPYAVDVSSGVEASPGKKDFIKLKRFIELVKSSSW